MRYIYPHFKAQFNYNGVYCSQNSDKAKLW